MLGWNSASATRVEGARTRLKRLVERGWLVEEKPSRSHCRAEANDARRRGGGS